MSQAVFPALPGLKWDVQKTPRWNTLVQQSVGGQEIRTAFFAEPLWTWTLKFEFLRQFNAYTEFATLAGFYNQRQGRWDSFLYTDPSDSTIADVAPYMQFGTGNGSTTAFQLSRTLGGAAEKIYDVNGTPNIYVNNVLKTAGVDYTISNGLVTFGAAPANGLVIAWSGSYYWRVRFADDTVDFNEFANNFWELQQLSFVSVK